MVTLIGLAGVDTALAKTPPTILAITCIGCHGAEGRKSDPEVPPLDGMDELELREALTAYKSGERQSDVMNSVVSDYSLREIEEIAEILAGADRDYNRLIPDFDLDPLYP